MDNPDTPSRGIRVDSRAWPVSHLLDDVFAAYIDWRGNAAAASRTYRRWAEEPADDRAARSSAYNAALDQEEASAISYPRSIAELKRCLQPGIVRTM